jgi:hypothetical protein
MTVNEQSVPVVKAAFITKSKALAPECHMELLLPWSA